MKNSHCNLNESIESLKQTFYSILIYIDKKNEEQNTNSVKSFNNNPLKSDHSKANLGLLFFNKIKTIFKRKSI